MLSRPSIVTLLLVTATVVWRRGDYFSGSLDAVVVGKGLLCVLALALAFRAAQSAGSARRRVGTGSLWFLAVLLGSSLLGALAHGTLLASGVVAVRVAMLAATVVFLLRAFPVMEVLAALVRACGVVAFVATVTGLGTLTSGRLEGGLPPLNPNELALLAGVVVLALVFRAVLDEARLGSAVLGAFYLGVMWATGSRTALLMVLLAAGVMAVYLRRPRVGMVVGALVVAAIGTVGMVATGAIGDFLERDGTGTSTLDSRFIAWGAARSWADTLWQQLLGGGMSVKLIPVSGQLWDTQLLDSTWVSALVQAGLLGLGAGVIWVLWTLRGAFRAPLPHRVLAVGLLVFLLGRSVLESGLFDATPSFLLFLTVALAVESGSRARLEAETADGTRSAEPVLVRP
ncbi:MAG: conserved rane protein of unknown function [Blastococcus sp.]|nr:conserved rane protein of unknown function [Blastococcus sp.]